MATPASEKRLVGAKRDCTAGQTVAGGSSTCSFTTFEAGKANRSATDGAAAATDDDGSPDESTASFGTLARAVTLTTSASAAVVTVQVAVAADSAAEAFLLGALTDDTFGDVASVVSTTCSVPQTMALGGSYSCAFDAKVGTSPHPDAVTCTDGGSITRSGGVTVMLE